MFVAGNRNWPATKPLTHTSAAHASQIEDGMQETEGIQLMAASFCRLPLAIPDKVDLPLPALGRPSAWERELHAASSLTGRMHEISRLNPPQRQP